jgi:hypothetical protein
MNSKKQILLMSINGKKISSGWTQKEDIFENIILYKYNKNKIQNWKAIEKENFLFENSKSHDSILQIGEKQYLFLEYLNPVMEYKLPLSTKISLKTGSFVDIGEPISEGIIDTHELLNIFFQYHYLLDGILIGVFRSLNKFQLLLVNSVQSIYQSQGVNISSKHIEIVVRQMTARVAIKESGDTPLVPGEIMRLSLVTEVYKALRSNENSKLYKTPKFEPLFTSTTVSSLGLVNNWKHYMFEMRSDVSYTNNKIYINGVSQALSQQTGGETAGNRNFNSGRGRIAVWVQDAGYCMPMNCAIFKIYDRALTQQEVTQNFNAQRSRYGI